MQRSNFHKRGYYKQHTLNNLVLSCMDIKYYSIMKEFDGLSKNNTSLHYSSLLDLINTHASLISYNIPTCGIAVAN